MALGSVWMVIDHGDERRGEAMNPQNYAARTTYRPPARWYQRLNRVGVGIIRLGLGPRDAVVLEVRGRVSGKARRLPILRTHHEAADYLVALAGESHWVRNVRAADGRAVLRRRGSTPVRLVELEAADRAPVIEAYLEAAEERGSADSAAGQARFYFGLDPDPSRADIESIARYYPVFRVDYDT